ncbi:54S ribosomal protein L25, mitochondrial [Saxophila tyrrhenica]|uniref:54S ribosomal protein L25, mitochondrial n=1 Tax=Saxophila tyrrhenica TaxID=1690608 RepID=A0AAV9PN18_9PEZI|nr:54S ribosomal protein L25, mitochondrial [Saxophila tyrrhenica]
MAAMESSISLARTLDPRLLRFFTRFPPPALRGLSQTPQSPSPETVQIAENTSSMDPNEGAATSTITPTPNSSPSPYPTTNDGRKHNPFLPFRNPSTGNWHSPHYSLRRQAVLFKLAQQHNVLPLMPLSPKHPEVKATKRLEQGLRVKGTGEGQKVKGKLWERTLQGRLEARRKAMEGMPEMVRQWKERGHGRGWKKWPR